MGLPDLATFGVDAEDHTRIAEAALETSSMKGNPVRLDEGTLHEVLERS